ncbi:copper-translocating P-type ATPase [Candidatus Photodesmus katoptron]|uniref:Copper-exporting P-type ATPase n=1 Tax=Candidatus Photodesmus katoptron Akat1 TaxID=1236703 RepID=S3EI57_9GAMM|nr:heavy metal translocating P-type ATPase [Candidatus Photodesmus katoptron]EPE37858.1 copper-transporting P-type ATPase [Candidatus Photodesmus katoptron Akat1]KEY90423.1 copper-translocating P-type ATPase [Candidatus Photodesmus katoptron]
MNEKNYVMHLFIHEMTCSACVAGIEKTILSIPKIKKVQFNLLEQSVLLVAEKNDKHFKDNLLLVLKNFGYQAEFFDNDSAIIFKQKNQILQDQKQLHKRNFLIGFIMAMMFMILGYLNEYILLKTTQVQIVWSIIGVICFFSFFISGKYFFVNAFRSLMHQRITMDILIVLGTGIAWLYSMLLVIFPSLFPEKAQHFYFEASVMIMAFVSLGRYIEAKAKSQTSRSLKNLIDLQPKHTTLITPKGVRRILVRKIKLGMSLLVKPGERIPVDGEVISGCSYVDESMLTGESIGIYKKTGNPVSAGTLNQSGSLTIIARSMTTGTALSKIIQLVRQARSTKPSITKFVDKILVVFIPVVILVALFSAFIWYLFGPEPKISYMLVVTSTVLIIACPCALGLATPLSIIVSMGKSAEMGILIKDADTLQSANKINVAVFDKTGTLTEGKPNVQHIYSFIAKNTNHILQLVYSAEQYSEHPLAKAICNYAVLNKIDLLQSSNFKNLEGRGITAEVNGKTILVASINYFEKKKISLSNAIVAIRECFDNLWTPIAVAINGKLVGIVAISDAIKRDSAAVIHSLKKRHIHTVMLTGDSNIVANSIGKQLGIDEIISEVLPNKKLEYIKKFQENGNIVAMVGDGINDAPSLVQSDIGIAMGNGSDITIASADITLLNSSLISVLRIIEIAKVTVKNIKQNLFAAFFYNILGIPIAAGALYPIFGFLLNPIFAGIAMVLSSITIVSNASRLRFFKTKF